MKNVKIFIGVCLVAMTMLFVYACTKDGADNTHHESALDLQTETRAAEPCENVIANCNGTPWITVPVSGITVDLYPGCQFDVIYKYRICNGKLDVSIEQWGDWPPCTAFNTDIINDQSIIGKVEKKIMTKIVDILLQNPLLNIPSCSSGRSTQIGFSTSTCVDFCIIPNGTQSTANGELVKVKYVKLNCGTACCKTTYEVCRSANGSLNITVGISQGTGNCTGLMPDIPCPMNSIGSTGCIPNCYLL